MILQLYYLCLTTLESINLIEVDYDELDVITDLKMQERILSNKLDPAIRHFLRKRGIKVIKNSYIGFDTEYVSKYTHNELVSAQLTLASRIYMQIPKNPKYYISSLDVERNKVEKISRKSNVFNIGKYELSVQ